MQGDSSQHGFHVVPLGHVHGMPLLHLHREQKWLGLRFEQPLEEEVQRHPQHGSGRRLKNSLDAESGVE